MSAPALLKGLDILECLEREGTELSLSQIAQSLGRNNSEIQRMVKSLCERGYIDRNRQGGYTLGFQLYKLGRMRHPYQHLQRVAEPIMSSFAAESGHSIHLGVEHQGRMLNLSGATGTNLVSVAVRMGSELSLESTLSGRLLRVCHAVAENSVAEKNKDARTLSEQGYLYQESEEYLGVRDLSVPVRWCQGAAYAALTCTWLERVGKKASTDEARPIFKKILQCARSMEDQLVLKLGDEG